MISYQELVKKPRAFKSITGLGVDEFEQLFEKLVPVWVEHEHHRLDRPDRKRAIGGGRKYTLRLRDRVVMVTCWLRLYLNTEAMGFFFGVDKSTVSRNCRRLLTVLRALGEEVKARASNKLCGSTQTFWLSSIPLSNGYSVQVMTMTKDGTILARRRHTPVRPPLSSMNGVGFAT